MDRNGRDGGLEGVEKSEKRQAGECRAGQSVAERYRVGQRLVGEDGGRLRIQELICGFGRNRTMFCLN